MGIMSPVALDRESTNAPCPTGFQKRQHPESLLPSASRKGELTFMAATSYRYLVNIPRQGKTIVEDGVHDVVGLILNGASVDDVCRSFPELSRAKVYECLAPQPNV